MTNDQWHIGTMRDDLEFSICQYLDGTLDEAGRGALEARLAEDPQARALLEAHRSLTAALQSAPLPQVRWEKLAESISLAIDQEAAECAARASWAIRVLRNPAWVALAASIILAAGIGIHFLTQNRIAQPAQPMPSGAPVALVVEGPQEDRSSGPAIEEVSIGPGGTYAHASSLAPYADDIDTRPTRVVLAAGTPVAAEEASQPSPF